MKKQEMKLSRKWRSEDWEIISGKGGRMAGGNGRNESPRMEKIGK